MNELISVVIPTYESSETIGDTLDSVINQTYKNIEIIIVDDYSKDFLELKKIVDAYDNKIIHLFRQSKNLNGACARNKGVELSHGEIICFLDSDDLWAKDKLELQIRAYSSGTVVSCKTSAVTRDNIDFPQPVRSNFDTKKNCFGNLFGSLEHNLVMQTSSIMISKSDLKLIGGFDESLFRHQDYQLAYSIDKFNLKVTFIELPLCFYVKDNRTAVQKGWTIERTDYFLTHYYDGFKDKELLHFVIVQLLGPALKNHKLKLWLVLCLKYKVNFLQLFTQSAIYLSKRLFR